MRPDETPLYMLRMQFDQRGLFDLGRRRRLPLRETDLGYLVHCHLGELFGELAPGPFAVTGAERRHLTVLAYSDRPKDALRQHADAFADPAVHAACLFGRFEAKPMPALWIPGGRLGFQVRICPIVRLGSGDAGSGKPVELDAFLARCRTAGPEAAVDRESVYRDWLAREIARHGAARLVRARLAAFQLDRVVRRRGDASRAARVFHRPSALIDGELEVTDGAAFISLLRRGLGRHRAFGFGMLLLRPLAARPC